MNKDEVDISHRVKVFVNCLRCNGEMEATWKGDKGAMRFVCTDEGCQNEIELWLEAVQ